MTHPKSASVNVLTNIMSARSSQVSSTLQHALVSMLVTSITTAAGLQHDQHHQRSSTWSSTSSSSSLPSFSLIIIVTNHIYLWRLSGFYILCNLAEYYQRTITQNCFHKTEQLQRTIKLSAAILKQSYTNNYSPCSYFHSDQLYNLFIII